MPTWDAVSRRSVRAAIVIPALFAFADQVVANPNTATFASLGGFAMLLLADFGGPIRERFVAYCTLAITGAAFIVIGTLCARTTWLAVLAAAVIGGGVLFAGILSGYAAKGSLAALLILVLPLTIPAGPSAIGPRLEGWALAAVVGTLSVFLLWREPPQAGLGSLAARALEALGRDLESQLDLAPAPTGDAAVASAGALERLRAAYLATSYRPAGATLADQAIVALVRELDWLENLIASHDDLPADGYAHAAPEDRALLAASAMALHDSAGALDTAVGAGSSLARRNAREHPLTSDIENLASERERAAESTARRVEAWRAGAPAVATETLQCAFHARSVATATATVASSALVASGVASPDAVRTEQERWYGAAAAPSSNFGEIARQSLAHADLRSVWLRNSLRGTLGFTVAVLVARLTGVQHGFWVVLGTLAVLRSNALGTGATALRSIAGTTLGFAVGSAILVGLGGHGDALWAVLPIAVLLAGYAPARISFLAGQAAFTVLLAVLFNIVQPTGWRVGLVRIEDVAIGCAISLFVGLLLWPRGAAPVVSLDLADAYRTGVEYLSSEIHQLLGRQGLAGPEQAAASATAASRRLDAAFRSYLAEQGSKNVHRAQLATLVGGADRLLLTANSLAALPMRASPEEGSESDVLDGELHEVARSFDQLADELAPRGGRTKTPIMTSEERRAIAIFESSVSSAEPSPRTGEAISYPDLVANSGPLGPLTPGTVCGRWIHYHLSHLLAGVEPLAEAASALPERDTAH
ncbi:MAG: hypothetical protein JWO62_2499 [Acidimicrobiaceae bacterium]|nr:hypothetical protein [Acidimicrobiaceae bacterium]